MPDTHQLIAAFGNGSFQILGLPNLQVRQTVAHHRLSVESVCYDAQRRWLFAGCEDVTISVWRKSEDHYRHYFTIDMKLGNISQLEFIGRGDRLVALIVARRPCARFASSRCVKNQANRASKRFVQKGKDKFPASVAILKFRSLFLTLPRGLACGF